MPGPFDFEGPAEVIAHRGFSAAAPENTLAAIDAAIAAGADAVEFDLLTTRDGVPVLFHDETLDRTTDGAGRVDERSWAELRSLDAGAWFSPAFAGEPVPSFEAALARIGGRLGRVYAEVKGASDAGALRRMIEVVEDAHMADRVVFIAIDWSVLGALREQRASLLIGYIVDEEGRSEEALERAEGDPSALLDFKGVIVLDDRRLARRVRERHVPMAAWTVDEPEAATRLLELGVPRITTNRVDVLTAWKATL